MSARLLTYYILWHDPSDPPQLELNPLLLDVGVLLLDLVGEPEANDGEALVVKFYFDQSIMLRWGIEHTSVFFVEFGLPLDQLASLVGECFSGSGNRRHSPSWLLTVDIRQNGEVTGVLERSRDQPGLGQVVLHDLTVPRETEVEDWNQLGEGQRHSQLNIWPRMG